MDQVLPNLKKKLGDKWLLFKTIHQDILSIHRNIDFRVFPIYISYYLDERMIAVVYFGGKFVTKHDLNVGLSLRKRPKSKRFVGAKYMKYPGIVYSIKLSNRANVPNILLKELKHLI